jgi:hypothetical protein
MTGRHGPTAPQILELEREVEVSLAQQSEDRYVRVPFDLPEGAPSIEARIEVLDPDAVIDLGCDGPRGWRGWSGGARRAFTIAADDATPGYVPGPPESGRWAVILGIHALEHGSARVRVQVSSPARTPVDHGPSPEPAARSLRGSDRDLPAPSGMKWFAGDTHAHSLHSDGSLSLNELADEAVLSGLDFLCVTDHNTTSHHRLLPEVGARHGITLVPGQEVTTHRGHANAFGDIGFVDFRLPVSEWASHVAAHGGTLSINHPVSGDCSWLHEIPEELDGMEIMHSDSYRDPISTAPFAWAQLVTAPQRHRPVPVLLAGADFHRRGDRIRPGTPTTWVCAEDDSPGAILAGIAAGRTALTSTLSDDAPRTREQELRPDLLGAPMLLRAGPARIHALRAEGGIVVDAGGQRRLVTAPDEEIPAPIERGPHRLESADRKTIAVCW